MRKFLGLFGFAALLCAGVGASEGFDDFLLQVRAGKSPEELQAYIDSSRVAFDLSVDEILYLRDVGVSSKIIAQVVNHGKMLREGAAVVQSTASVVPVVEHPVAPPANEVNISFLYDSMAPYGKWIQVEGVWYWQPTSVLVDRSWRPYCNRGHWVYTDWGWAWYSDYSWGWAPFHYGRWVSHRDHGWLWTPDTVWGPAWVTWRSGEGHYGWAPLPPGAAFRAGVGFQFLGKDVGLDFSFGLTDREFCFVPAEHFCEPVLHKYSLQPAEVARIYHQTKFIQNSYVYSGNHLVHNGPPVASVSHFTNTKIKPVHLVEADITAGQRIHGDRIQKDSMVVYRPRVAEVPTHTPEVLQAKGHEQPKRAVVATPAELETRRRDLQVSVQRERDHLQLAADHEGDKQSRRELEVTADELKRRSKIEDKSIRVEASRSQDRNDQRDRRGR